MADNKITINDLEEFLRLFDDSFIIDCSRPPFLDVLSPLYKPDGSMSHWYREGSFNLQSGEGEILC